MHSLTTTGAHAESMTVTCMSCEPCDRHLPIRQYSVMPPGRSRRRGQEVLEACFHRQSARRLWSRWERKGVAGDHYDLRPYPPYCLLPTHSQRPQRLRITSQRTPKVHATSRSQKTNANFRLNMQTFALEST